MTDAVALSLAEKAYLTLLQAQRQPIATAADSIRGLKEKTRNSGNQSHQVVIAQADAWLAICALSTSLDNDHQAASEVWSRAISRTEEWRNLLD